MLTNANKGDGIMKAKMVVAVLAGFLAVGLSSHRANADGLEQNSYWHLGDHCADWARVLANCLTVEIVNNALGARYSAVNECSDYGDIVAHINVKGANDEHFHMEDSTKHSGLDVLYHVNSITCCIDDSDLCHKGSVEKSDGGWIMKVTVSDGSWDYEYVNISTHQKRYDFCQDNPDQIYCEIDPDGDSSFSPAQAAIAAGNPACSADNSCNCGDHYCTAADCDREWSESYAAARTDGFGCKDAEDPDWSVAVSLYNSDTWGDEGTYGSSIDAVDGTSQQCTITTGCRKGTFHRSPYYLTNTVTDAVSKLDQYFACNASEGATPLHDGCW